VAAAASFFDLEFTNLEPLVDIHSENSKAEAFFRRCNRELVIYPQDQAQGWIGRGRRGQDQAIVHTKLRDVRHPRDFILMPLA